MHTVFMQAIYILIGCPNNVTLVNCSSNPCLSATCTNYPNAQCIPEYCGSCRSRYFFEGQEVTDVCSKSMIMVSTQIKSLFPACPPSMVVIPCSKNCTPTCQNPEPNDCKETTRCTPACGCPKDLVFDEKTQICINLDSCGKPFHAVAAITMIILVQDTCNLTAIPGPCHGIYPRWFFNSASRHCQLFSYSGCGGNSNRFETLKGCTNACGKLTYVSTSLINVNTLGCESGSPRQCSHDPCDRSTCPSYPDATCEVDECNPDGCKAKYYLISDQVTDSCGKLN